MHRYEIKQEVCKPPAEYLVYFDGIGIWKARYEMRDAGMYILDIEELPSCLITSGPVTIYNKKSLRFLEGSIL